MNLSDRYLSSRLHAETEDRTSIPRRKGGPQTELGSRVTKKKIELEIKNVCLYGSSLRDEVYPALLYRTHDGLYLRGDLLQIKLTSSNMITVEREK